MYLGRNLCNECRLRKSVGKQEVLQSQLHVRQLLDICCRHLAAAGAALSGEYASMRSQAKAKLGVGMSLALRYIFIHCPQSLVALDLKPVQIALDASAHIEVGPVLIWLPRVYGRIVVLNH